MAKNIAAAFFLFFSFHVSAQVLPKEGSQLNYRYIGFLFPETKPGYKNIIELASGNFYNEDSFKRNIVKSFLCSTNKIIGEVPSFGQQYTWRIVSSSPHKPVKKSELHRFSTKINLSVDTTHMRLKILKQAETYKDAYVFMDGNKTLYDMKGHPVWFLPLLNNRPADKIWGFGDLNFTNDGTITYLITPNGGQVYEADFNGTILWRGPNNGVVTGDTIEHYNHEFVKLNNGHYMVLANEPAVWKLPGSVDTSILNNRLSKDKIIRDSNNVYYQKMHFGVLIEYDRNGSVVWTWRSSKYFEGSDIYNHVNSKGVYDIDDVHENSFYFDEKNKVVYLGFRDISRIIKVKYPEGNILNVYGKISRPESPGYDNSMYYHQHSCRLSEDGHIYLYNNNNRSKESKPTLVVLQEPVSENDTLSKIWEYQCTLDGFDSTLKQSPDFSALGSILELPDHSFLACMTANNYTQIFIVNRSKKILWNALLQRQDQKQHKWYSVIQYRANIIVSRKQLEQLIWNGENNINE